MSKVLPRDIDLTHNLVFSKNELVSKSIVFPKYDNDSYKRYNEYENNPFANLTSSSSSFYVPSFKQTSSTFGSILPTIKIEERVCWRKLYKDPNIYEQSYSEEEWEEKIKNYNFPMGSRFDRAKIKEELYRKSHDPYRNMCERCGVVFNPRNCLSHVYGLCYDCNVALENSIHSLSL